MNITESRDEAFEAIAEMLRSKYECKDEESYSNGKYLSVSWLYELEGEEAVGYL